MIRQGRGGDASFSRRNPVNPEGPLSPDALCSEKSSPMPIVLNEWATSQEISNRIDRLRMLYAGNPLVRQIDHRIGVDWSDDPAVFIDVILARKDIPAADLQRLAEDLRSDLLRLVRTDEIGLHSYLNFVN